MFEIWAVTNRLLCSDKNAFLYQVEKIASSGVKALILREKDLPENEYEELAISVAALCEKNNVRFIVHTFLETARRLNTPLHLPWNVFYELQKNNIHTDFGVSVHSTSEAVTAAGGAVAATASETAAALETAVAATRASWLLGGHIFQTKCKEGLEGRGPQMLSDVCKVSKAPVYGIGGIDSSNIELIVKSGAQGACLMSSLMLSPDPEALVNELLAKIKPNQHYGQTLNKSC